MVTFKTQKRFIKYIVNQITGVLFQSIKNRYRFIKRPFLSGIKIIQYFKTVYYDFIIALTVKRTLKKHYFKPGKNVTIYKFIV